MGPDDEHGQCVEISGGSHGFTSTVFEELFELQGSINVKGDVFC